MQEAASEVVVQPAAPVEAPTPIEAAPADVAAAPAPVEGQAGQAADSNVADQQPVSSNEQPVATPENEAAVKNDLITHLMTLDENYASMDEAAKQGAAVALQSLDTSMLKQAVAKQELTKRLLEEVFKDTKGQALTDLKNEIAGKTLEELQDYYADEIEVSLADNKSMTGVELKQAPKELETSPNERSMAELKARWMGGEGQDGLFKGALKATYYEEFLGEAQNEFGEEIEEAVIADVYKEFNEEYQAGDKSTDLLVAWSDYQKNNQQEIKRKVDQKAKEKYDVIIEQKVSAKFEELKEGSPEEFLQAVFGEKIDFVDELNFEDKNLPPQEQEKKTLLKSMQDFILAGAAAGGEQFVKYLSTGVKDSNAQTFFSLLFGADMARLHSGALRGVENYKDADAFNLKQFTGMVEKNKESGESSFQAYDKILNGLGKSISDVTERNSYDGLYVSKLEPGDKPGLQKKALKIYDDLSTLIKDGKAEKVNEAFFTAIQKHGVKGDFKKESKVTADVLKHFFEIQHNQFYNYYVEKDGKSEAESDEKKTSEKIDASAPTSPTPTAQPAAA